MQIQAQKDFQKHMKDKLVKKPWIIDHRNIAFHYQTYLLLTSPISLVMPDFSVTCRRLTPGPGYLEALDSDNVIYLLPDQLHEMYNNTLQVDFVPTTIKRITETGIELVDGTKHNLDILILATGRDTVLTLQALKE